MDNDPLITTLFVATRAVHFGACLLLFGILVFDLLIASLVVARYPMYATRWMRVIRSLTALSLPLALVSGAAWLTLNAITMSGLPAAEALHAEVIRLVLTETHFGKLWEIRSALWLVALVLTTAAISFPALSLIRRVFTWPALLSSGALAASLAWAGHGLTGEPAQVHLWADALHILISGCWPIGLLPLAMLLHILRGSLEPTKWQAISSLVRRFSTMSLVSVALLTLSGIMNSWVLVGSVSNLFSTLYGKVLLAKIAMFCAMVFLGAINVVRLKPHLAIDLADGIATEHEPAAGRLQTNVAIEIAFAVGVFVLVGLLGLLPPAMEAMMHAHHHP